MAEIIGDQLVEFWNKVRDLPHSHPVTGGAVPWEVGELPTLLDSGPYCSLKDEEVLYLAVTENLHGLTQAELLRAAEYLGDIVRYRLACLDAWGYISLRAELTVKGERALV